MTTSKRDKIGGKRSTFDTAVGETERILGHSCRQSPKSTECLTHIIEPHCTCVKMSPRLLTGVSHMSEKKWRKSTFKSLARPDLPPVSKGWEQRASVLGARTLLVAPGLTTRSKKLLATKGIATTNILPRIELMMKGARKAPSFDMRFIKEWALPRVFAANAATDDDSFFASPDSCTNLKLGPHHAR